MDLYEIQQMPTLIDTVHESCYRAYHILAQVMKMVERGDSKESIFEVATLLGKIEKDKSQS